MIILETERLILRHFFPSDLAELFALYGDPEIRRYFPDGTLTFEETREELEWYLNGHPDHPELGLWATIHKQIGRFIGRCGLLPWTIEQRDEVEIAYLLNKSFWRQGLGTEVACGLLGYGFVELRLPRLICMMFKQNEASRRVALSVGMRFEKEIVADFGPAMLYALSKQAWDGG